MSLVAKTNHEIARDQITKHKVDRYPSVQMQLIKCMEELGELAKEINKGYSGLQNNARKEAADLALSLYNLADKCGFDLDREIMTLVLEDDREF